MHAHAQLTRLLGTLHCRCRCRCRCEGALMISANTHKIGFLLSVFISFQFSLFYFSFKENSLLLLLQLVLLLLLLLLFFCTRTLKPVALPCIFNLSKTRMRMCGCVHGRTYVHAVAFMVAVCRNVQSLMARKKVLAGGKEKSEKVKFNFHLMRTRPLFQSFFFFF